VLAKTLSRLKPDLIHSNGIKFHLLAGLAAPRRVPLVWHIHDFISLRPFLTMALRITSIRARGAFAVSRAVQQDAQAIFPRFPVELIYNGIDTDEFSPGLVPGVRLDHLAGLPEARSETVRIGLVATYARWKGHEVFLKAAAQLLRVSQRPPVRFYLVGGPIYQTSGSQFSTDELRTIAAGLNIGADIGFIPFQHKPAEVYRALNIVVHASTQPEPFGRTIVEGMACAKPVIAAQSGGAAELFTHNYDAMGVPPNDPAALATAICGLTINPDRRRTLGNNARQTAVEQFSRHRLGPQIHALYRLFTRAARAA
jgi:glycosyltransferase involved in cell wall biosynthesis